MLSDPDPDPIGLKRTKDIDQVYFWDIFAGGVSAMGQSLGTQRRVRRVTARTLGDTVKGVFIATLPRCSLEEKRLNGKAGRNCSRPSCAANENSMQSL